MVICRNTYTTFCFFLLAGWKFSLKTTFFLRLHYGRASHAPSIRSDESKHINLALPRCIDCDAQSIPGSNWREIHLGHEQLSMELWPPSTIGERGEKRGYTYECLRNVRIPRNIWQRLLDKTEASSLTTTSRRGRAKVKQDQALLNADEVPLRLNDATVGSSLQYVPVNQMYASFCPTRTMQSG